MSEFAWMPESTKPPEYETVLIELAHGDFTTGFWVNKRGWWAFAFGNLYPPRYELKPGSVIAWAAIERQKGLEAV